MPARSWQERRIEIEQKLVRDTGMDIKAWNAKVRAELGLSSPAELDAEALGWLQRAYEANV